MHYNNTRLKYTGSALPGISEAITLFDSAAFVDGAVQFGPLQHHNAQWFVYFCQVDANTNNTIAFQYSDDGGTTFTTFQTDTISNAGTGQVDGEAYIGHFEHVRVIYTNGLTAQTTFSMNINLHCGDRSPIGI